MGARPNPRQLKVQIIALFLIVLGFILRGVIGSVFQVLGGLILIFSLSIKTPEPLKCSKCGTVVPSNKDNFCRACGFSLK
jgi:hypothetical protein